MTSPSQTFDDGYEVVGTRRRRTEVLGTQSLGQPHGRAKTPQVKSVKTAFLVPVRCQCFTAIEKHTDHTGHVHLDFNSDGGVVWGAVCKNIISDRFSTKTAISGRDSYLCTQR